MWKLGDLYPDLSAQDDSPIRAARVTERSCNPCLRRITGTASASTFRTPSGERRVRAPHRRLTAAASGRSWCTPGRSWTVFQDDRTYPFEAHAPFKVWTPLDDAPDCFVWFEPGSRPRLILNQPRGLLVQGRQTPQDYWVEHFDLRSVRGPRCSTGSSCPRTSRARPTSAMRSRSSPSGPSGPSIRPRSCAGWIMSGRPRPPTSSRACAKPTGSAHSGIPPPHARFARGASEFEIELAFLQALRAARAGTAVQPDHRAE